MTEKESCDWIMRVDLHLPTPDEMPDEMLEIAASIAWVNYRVEGTGCLWLGLWLGLGLGLRLLALVWGFGIGLEKKHMALR